MDPELDYTRQLDLCPQEALRELELDLIGVGGIGSWVALALAKLGVGSLRVWDFDIVEGVNIPSQAFRLSDVGIPKVEALRALCKAFAGADIEAVQERVSDQTLRPIVVSALDSMVARQAVWQGAIKGRPVEFYIDARMGGHSLLILTVRPTSPVEMSTYEETLYSDDEALPLPCTARAMVSWPMVAAGLLVRQVIAIARDDTEPARRLDAHLGPQHPFIVEESH